MKYINFFLLVFVFIPFGAFAQQIANVKAVQDGKQITVNYDITGYESWHDFTVSLLYSPDGYSWQPVTKGISGDYGTGIKGGSNKQITWDVLQQVDRLVGNSYMFKVKAIVGGQSPTLDYTETTAGLNINMVYVQGGTFTMGCTEQGSDCEDDEKPTHSVKLDGFYIAKTEVTQAQWKAIMGSNPSYFSGCDQCPVENVNWNDAQDFITKLNQKTGKKYSLPTEAQWEYAARGGNKSSGYKYSGSNNIEEVAWYIGNSDSKTNSVEQNKANELGLYDMSGNVWEWCSDWYGTYSSNSQTNPQGATIGSDRVLRGGSWSSDAGRCRVSYRGDDTPGYRGSIIGFRLVCVP